MTCEELAPLYEEYALGVLEGAERAELEAHLARAGDRCVQGVARARGVVSQFAHAAPDAQPPAALRGKIMGAIENREERAQAVKSFEEPRPSRALGPFPVWAWAAAAALALITGYAVQRMNRQYDQLAQLRKEMKLALAQNQALQNQIDMEKMVNSVMMSPDSKPLKLMPVKDKGMPMVHAYLHPHMGVAITAEEMPSLPAARTLQLWSVPKSGKPMSLAIFHPDAMGQIAIVAPVPMPQNEIAELAITDEPAGGSPQPTSPVAWMAAVN